MSNILIVEDERYVADATRLWLSIGLCANQVESVTTASEARNTLATDSTRWSLILLDLMVPGAVGLSLATHIRDLGLAPITCILTGTYRRDYIQAARRDGFLGYLLKAQNADFIVEELRKALAGERVFPPATDAPSRPHSTLLTPRQRAVISLVARGRTSKEIGRVLALKPGTVETHIKASIAALGASNRAEAAATALTLGLVSIDD